MKFRAARRRRSSAAAPHATPAIHGPIDLVMPASRAAMPPVGASTMAAPPTFAPMQQQCEVIFASAGVPKNADDDALWILTARGSPAYLLRGRSAFSRTGQLACDTQVLAASDGLHHGDDSDFARQAAAIFRQRSGAAKLRPEVRTATVPATDSVASKKIAASSHRRQQLHRARVPLKISCLFFASAHSTHSDCLTR